MIEVLLIIYLAGALLFAFVSGLVFEMYSSLDHLRPKTFNRIMYHTTLWPFCLMFLLGVYVYDAYKNFNPRGNF